MLMDFVVDCWCWYFCCVGIYDEVDKLECNDFMFREFFELVYIVYVIYILDFGCEVYMMYIDLFWD